MEYELNQINYLVHLVSGNIGSYLAELLHSPENYETELPCLKEFIGYFKKNFSNDDSNGIVDKLFDDFEQKIQTICDPKKELYNKVIEYMDISIPIVGEVCNILYKLSQILNVAKIKAVLCLSPTNNPDIAKKLYSEEIFNQLLEIDSDKNCLIMPQTKYVQSNNVNVFTAFKHIEMALRNIDVWPGVLLWTDKRVAFVPIKSGEELKDLFNKINCICKDEKYFKWDKINPFFDYLENIEECKKDNYIFHISDLHIGKSKSKWKKRKNELLDLLETQKSSIGVYASVKVIITGDILDAPDIGDQNVIEFVEEIRKRNISNEEIIKVDGNHDDKFHGFRTRPKKIRRTIDKFDEDDNVKVYEETKTIFILIDSNITDDKGSWAKGEVGTYQMGIISRKLKDLYKEINADDYCKIVMLHHHVIPIGRLDLNSMEFLERVKVRSFIDNIFLKLEDSGVFLKWLKDENINFVFHGHKHAPRVIEFEEATHIGCGSSTGYKPQWFSVSKKDIAFVNDIDDDSAVEFRKYNDVLISFNQISYNPKTKQPSVCTLLYKNAFRECDPHLSAYILKKYPLEDYSISKEYNANIEIF